MCEEQIAEALPTRPRSQRAAGSQPSFLSSGGGNRTSFAPEELVRNREFSTYAIPEENAA